MSNHKMKEPKLDERSAAPCKFCAKKGLEIYPIIKEMEEMYYAQCPKCNKHDLYEFLGITEKRAIDRWNNCQCSKGDELY